MSTYKVIQDIEAEDHLVGPLSFRQFVYALIGIFLYYLCFICLTKGAAYLLVILLPPAFFCTFFALPLGGEQPTEVWALAKIRFYFKPRRRIWNQSGVKELVTVTVPKKIETQLTDGLSQNEVKSRLRALADTIDSRGWVIKNVASNAYVRPGMGVQQTGSDRLLTIESMPQPVPDYDVPSTDVLEQTGPLSQHLGSMIQDSTAKHRQQLIDIMNGQRAAIAAQQTQSPQWFQQPTVSAAPVAAAAMSPSEEAAISADLKQRLAAQAQHNLHQLQPHDSTVTTLLADDTTDTQTAVPTPKTPVTPVTDPAILSLAKRDDLNVSTLAREAGKQKGLDDGHEVVISLH